MLRTNLIVLSIAAAGLLLGAGTLALADARADGCNTYLVGGNPGGPGCIASECIDYPTYVCGLMDGPIGPVCGCEEISYETECFTEIWQDHQGWHIACHPWNCDTDEKDCDAVLAGAWAWSCECQ